MKPTLVLLLMMVFTWSAWGQPPASDLPQNPAATIGELNPKLPTLFVAGDSTAAKNNGNPVQGWGVPFAEYFDSTKINVVNLARGGRSSRTFITEGLWDALLSHVKKGDYVIIQFGHNDAGAINAEPPGSTRPLRARGSLPGVGEESQEIDNVLTHKHEVVHTFGWYIRKMISDTEAKGGIPIVVSLTVRNHWNNGQIEVGSGNYRAWDREIAEKAGVPFLDLTKIVSDRYQKMGEAALKDYFVPDRIHLSKTGADDQASCVVAGLRGIYGEKFDAYLSAKGKAVVPVKE